MAGKSYLVLFEQMVELLAKNKLKAFPIHNLGIHGGINRNELYITGDEADEKFRGTWWQIKIPYKQSERAEFNYVADSLRDALRLKPELDISYWSCSTESVHDFVNGTNEWIDELDDMELLVLD